MTNQNWTLLENVTNNLVTDKTLPKRLELAVAGRIEEAMTSATKSPLDSLSKQLASFLDRLVEISPQEASNASHKSLNIENPSSVAYHLGMFSFAQLLTAQISERRVDDSFFTILRDIRYKPYVLALGKSDRSGKQLSEECAECVETVSRKLRYLREIGITDYRREGTAFINFLTPTAKSAIKSQLEPTQLAKTDDSINASHIAAARDVTPERMRRTPIFLPRKVA